MIQKSGLPFEATLFVCVKETMKVRAADAAGRRNGSGKQSESGAAGGVERARSFIASLAQKRLVASVGGGALDAPIC